MKPTPTTRTLPAKSLPPPVRITLRPVPGDHPKGPPPITVNEAGKRGAYIPPARLPPS